MNLKSKYYKVLDLPDGASAVEIKKAFRKLAMQYHPDRNPDPKANLHFIRLTEAYEILMNQRPIPSSGGFSQSAHARPTSHRSTTGKTHAQKSFEERVRMAKERTRQQQIRNEQRKAQFFSALTSGVRWRIYKLTVIFSTLFAVALILDQFLPRHVEDHLASHYTESYSGLESEDITRLHLYSGLSFFVEKPRGQALYISSEIKLERSFILHNPVRIWVHYFEEIRPLKVDFSVVNLFPLFPIVFLFPFLTYLNRKKRTLVFYLSYNVSQYVIGGLLLYLLLTENRIFHLLTFGIF